MVLVASTIPAGAGYTPTVIWRDHDGRAQEFALAGVFDDAGEAIAQAIAAIDAMRAELRGPAPDGYAWG